MKEEHNIEVDENDNVIGSKPKSYFHDAKGIHRSVVLILLNSKKQMLLQKRAMTKRWYPGLWTYSVAGTVVDGNCDDSIKKETSEEIGISPNPRFLFKFLYYDDIDKAFFYLYLTQGDELVSPDKREIDEIRWIGLEDLKLDIEKNPDIYTPPFVYGMKLYFQKYH